MIIEARAYIKNVRITPKKLRMLLPAIKKLTPQDAIDKLAYTPQKSARIFAKAISSALSNAKNVLKLPEDQLKFKTLLIEEGQRLKRFRAGGRGVAKPYRRKYAHIKIVLEKK